VAHVISYEESGLQNTRGVDIRNIGNGPGRTINAVIEDCEFSGSLQGIRLANFSGSDNCEIHAVMSNNRSHGNKSGCLLANNGASSGFVDVHSYRDQFENNGVGCWIEGLIGAGQKSRVKFEAEESKFVDNQGQFDRERGGIVTSGADIGSTGTVSGNEVEIVLRGCEIRGNQVTDFEAFGARASGGTAMNNTVTIRLYGASDFKIETHDLGTNTVNVISEEGAVGGP
jgi:hypothetical protein